MDELAMEKTKTAFLLRIAERLVLGIDLNSVSIPACMSK